MDIDQSSIRQLSRLDSFEKRLLGDGISLAFDKPLSSEYSFDDAQCFFIYDDYLAGAIVKTISSMNYLDKLFVQKELRGKGVGVLLLQRVIDKYPQLLWRASLANPYISFYNELSDRSVELDDWLVYLKGYKDDEAALTISQIIQKESDFDSL